VIGPSQATVNTIITLRADTALLDRGEIRWHVNGIELDGEHGLRLVPVDFSRGDIIHATVTKGSMTLVSNELSLQNSPPVIRRGAIKPATPNVTDRLSLNIDAHDIDGDQVSYSCRWSVNGTFAGDAPYLMDNFKRGDVVTAKVTPHDRDDNGKSITLSATIANAHPSVSEGTSQFDGTHFVHAIAASDPDNDALTYTVTEGPEGMTVDSARGILNWKPRTDEAGRHEIKVMIDDGNGGKIILPIYTTIRFDTASN
jgi:hypothetical protein